jgi:hypothetical protein
MLVQKWIIRALDEKDQHCLKWKRALEGLTPGGSEFVDDPEACARFVRERRASQRDLLIRANKRVKAALDKQRDRYARAWMRTVATGNGKHMDDVLGRE